MIQIDIEPHKRLTGEQFDKIGLYASEHQITLEEAIAKLAVAKLEEIELAKKPKLKGGPLIRQVLEEAGFRPIEKPAPAKPAAKRKRKGAA